MDFIISLKSNFLAIGQIFVLGSFGFYVLRRGILGECCLRTLSNLVLDVTLPCFIFTNILANFHLVRGEAWYMFPLYCLGLFAISGTLGALALGLNRGIKTRGEFLSLVTFQNSGFLPIIIVNAVAPPEIAARMFIYIFLFILVFTPVLFSLAQSMFGQKGVAVNWKDLFNPASVTTVVALAMALPGLQNVVPDILFEPLKLVGAATIPLSMIVVGGIVMINFSGNTSFPFGYVLQVGVVKLLLVPLAVFGLVLLLPLPPEAKFLVLLQAMMPSGIMLPLLARKYQGDYTLVGQSLFGVTLMSLFTVPLLLSLFGAVPGG